MPKKGHGASERVFKSPREGSGASALYHYSHMTLETGLWLQMCSIVFCFLLNFSSGNTGAQHTQNSDCRLILGLKQHRHSLTHLVQNALLVGAEVAVAHREVKASLGTGFSERKFCNKKSPLEKTMKLMKIRSLYEASDISNFFLGIYECTRNGNNMYSTHNVHFCNFSLFAFYCFFLLV